MSIILTRSDLLMDFSGIAQVEIREDCQNILRIFRSHTLTS